MKKAIGVLVVLVVLTSSAFCYQDTVSVAKADTITEVEKLILEQQEADRQEKDTKDQIELGSNRIVQVIDDYDGTDVVVGRYGNVIVIDRQDTVRIKIGSKGIKITETWDGTNIEIIEPTNFEKEFNYHYKKRFKGHWAGFEMGMNNYLTPDFTLPGDYMSLNTGKSWNVNINFIQYSLNIAKNSFGLVTGLGLQMNDYKFNGNNSIEKDPVSGDIIELPWVENLKMSKLHVDYLTLPLIFEVHPSNKLGRKLYFGAGMIGSMKLRSYTKVKYYVDGKKNKEKTFNDYNISPLQYAVTFRAGFKAIRIFANYNLQPLFQSDIDPELYPFSVGLSLIPF
ncbi:MAG: outer membrane beta-barrel protein [Bacteroidota bacterium]|nr:outer membrane beta-barrel protein [Bacteroidota bacterium]